MKNVSTQIGNYLVKYSDNTNSWEVLQDNIIIADYWLKSTAVSFAKRQNK